MAIPGQKDTCHIFFSGHLPFSGPVVGYEVATAQLVIVISQLQGRQGVLDLGLDGNVQAEGGYRGVSGDHAFSDG